MAVIGRNELITPRLIDRWNSDAHGWTAYGYGEQRAGDINFDPGGHPITGGSGYRMRGSNVPGFVAIKVADSGLQPGTPFLLYAWVATVTGKERLLGLVPELPGIGAPLLSPDSARLSGAKERVMDGAGADELLKAIHLYDTDHNENQDVMFEGVVPDIAGLEYRDAGNNPQTLDSGVGTSDVAWWIVADGRANGNGVWLGGARIDFGTYPGGYHIGEHGGYVDGGMDDTAEAVYSWDGPRLESPTTVTAVGEPEPDPDPEDPDPEDPDPEDPDPEDPDPEDPEPEDPDPEDPDPEDPDPEDPEPEDPEPEDPEPEEPARVDIFDVSDLTGPVIRLLSMPEGYQEDVAREVCSVIASMAYAYTRGAAFTETETGQLRVSKPVVRHVIISAATRLMANPTGLAYRAGSESITTEFTGWTLGERESLNLYRKRWA